VIASCRAVRVPGDENAAERALAAARGDTSATAGQGVTRVPKPSRDGLIIPGTKEARNAARLARGLEPEPEEDPVPAGGDETGAAGMFDADDDILGAVIGLDRGKFSGQFD
jgi:hypothetical protein